MDTPTSITSHYKSITFLVVIAILASGCGVTQEAVKQPTLDSPEPTVPEYQYQLLPVLYNVPSTPREFRGAWVATVNNIDWPSRPGLPVRKQKKQLQNIMENAAELHLNTVILQIRPAAVALYDSPYEPWSYFLTGQQGEPPDPYYDPLKYAIDQAHKRGIELHVWFNPFRAYHPTAESYFAPTHIKNEHPEWVVQYGNLYWLNPGIKKVRQKTIKLIMDVVHRYDIDGVHLDDYFYPYPIRDSGGNFVPFPDDAAYHRYVEAHEPIAQDVWRRHNVNMFVKKLGNAIQKADPTLLFGISPFGIWRPHHPPQVVGFNAYDRIYADARKWIRKGWVDYLAPQLYWRIDNKGQRFPTLLKWWKQQNIDDRFIWPGLFISKVRNYPEYGWPPTEIINQVDLSREILETPGQIYFSMNTLMQNANNISQLLHSNFYKQEALLPVATWHDTKEPSKPNAVMEKNAGQYSINLLADQAPWLWVVKAKYGQNWVINIYPGDKQTVQLPEETEKGRFVGAAVSVVNNQSVESKPTFLFPFNRAVSTLQSMISMMDRDMNRHTLL